MYETYLLVIDLKNQWDFLNSHSPKYLVNPYFMLSINKIKTIANLCAFNLSDTEKGEQSESHSILWTLYSR